MRYTRVREELWECGPAPVYKGGVAHYRRQKTKGQVIAEFKEIEKRRHIEMGVNKVIIVGNVGQEPEMRFIPSGSAVTSFRVAASRRYKDGSSNTVEETEWFNVVTWGKLAETCNQYLTKGRLVYVEGRLQTRQWDDRNGNRRTKPEIVATNVQFLGKGASDIASEDMKAVEQLGEISFEAGIESDGTEEPAPKPKAAISNKRVVKPA